MIELLLTAQAAVAAIKAGCEMLRDGKSEIASLKETITQGVTDAKAIFNEVKGVWGWLKSLFGDAEPEPPAPAPQASPEPAPTVTPAKKTKPKAPELTYEQYQSRAVHQIFQHLKVFFEAQRQLQEHCRELEQQSKTTDKVADAALDRIEVMWQLAEMSKQVRQAMIYETPQELGLADLYKQFLQMYDQILEEQEFDRELKQKRERDAKWQRELLKHHRIDRAVVTAAVVLAVLWMWALLLSLGWLVRTPGGLSSGW